MSQGESNNVTICKCIMFVAVKVVRASCSLSATSIRLAICYERARCSHYFCTIGMLRVTYNASKFLDYELIKNASVWLGVFFSKGKPSFSRCSTYICATFLAKLRILVIYRVLSVTEITPLASNKLKV